MYIAFLKIVAGEKTFIIYTSSEASNSKSGTLLITSISLYSSSCALIVCGKNIELINAVIDSRTNPANNVCIPRAISISAIQGIITNASLLQANNMPIPFRGEVEA